MHEERSIIFRLDQLAIILALIASIALCGCITSGNTDGAKATIPPVASIPANITPVPLAIANNTSLPLSPVKNTSTAIPSPLPPNASIKVGSSLTPGLPPAVMFTHVPAYGSSEALTGTVAGIDDPGSYRLAIYVYSYGWYSVPSGDSLLTNISDNGTWSCNISSVSAAKKATEIDVFLVHSGYVPSKVSGRPHLPTDIRDNAIIVNSVTRKIPQATPAPTAMRLDSDLPNYIY